MFDSVRPFLLCLLMQKHRDTWNQVNIIVTFFSESAWLALQSIRSSLMLSIVCHMSVVKSDKYQIRANLKISGIS